MMTIKSERSDKSSLVMFLSGRLDTATAPQLERKIKQWGEDITELILDFSELTYISSMGLRVLLQTQRAMTASGRKLTIRHMRDSVREVFEMTGFIKLLVQEEKFVVIRKEEPPTTLLSLIGQMDADNVPLLVAELTQIREANQLKEDTTVVLDVEKLTHLSDSGCKALRRAINDTAWPKRSLTIRNAYSDIRFVFESNGMTPLLEP